MGLHCLHRPFCSKTCDNYGIPGFKLGHDSRESPSRKIKEKSITHTIAIKLKEK